MDIKQIITAVVAMVALSDMSAVTVLSVTAQQRYPWNGLVDLLFTVTGEANEAYDVPFVAKDVVGGTNLTMATLLDAKGASVSASDPILPGTYHWIWNAIADLPDGFKCERVVVSGMEDEYLGGVQLWANGPYWAECNVGASKPEEFGYYFWWGDTVGYKRNASNDGWVSVKDGTSFVFTPSNCPVYYLADSGLQSKGYIDTTGNLVAAHDAATVHLGAPWRMPTKEEFLSFNTNCVWSWTAKNGVYGRLVTGQGAYASKSIFLPGAPENDSFSNTGSSGIYWTSATDRGYQYESIVIFFSSNLEGHFHRNSRSRYRGFPVRPVRGFVK